MENIALKDLIYRLADDLLILGHRNSEWTGIGPILEEDISFSSMAQDKIGQSLALYNILHELDESDPDTVAFTRNANQFHNAQFVELPIGEYDFSLVRHFLFDHAQALYFESLSNSSYQSLAQVATKFKGEIRYHVMHANTWIKQLGTTTEEARERMQGALDIALPYALGLFEPSQYQKELAQNGIFEGDESIQQRWEENITKVISETNLVLPDLKLLTPHFGGRQGEHTEYLQPLLDEMSEVFRIDPAADW